MNWIAGASLITDFAFLVLDAAIVGCTLHYLWFCLAELKYIDRRSGPLSPAAHKLRFVYFAFVLVGVFIVGYGSIKTLLIWAPDTTTSFGSGDQFVGVSDKDLLAWFSGLCGAPLLFGWLQQVFLMREETRNRSIEKRQE